MTDAEQLKAQLRTRHVPASEMGRVVVSMLRLGMAPYVMHSYGGDISLATMEPSLAPGDRISMVFDRVRGLTPTEAKIARDAGAGEFFSHQPAPPTADDIPDPTG